MRLGAIVAAALVPALAFAAPKVRTKRKKAPPVAKPVEPPSDLEPTPDPPGDPKPAATAPPSAGPAGTAGGSGAAPADPKDAKDKDAKDARDAKKDADSEPKAGEVDVDSLRQEYLALRDELFKSRARASTVASQL